MEDRIRFQLEQSDRLQGFQILCDTNSGFGSICQTLVSEYIRDEVPKAPLLLYSLRNNNVFKSEEKPEIEAAKAYGDNLTSNELRESLE